MKLATGLSSRVAFMVVFLFAIFSTTNVVADTDHPGKAIIYLITQNTGTFSSVLISVNGKLVGSATPATHLVIVANPGSVEIGSAGVGRGSISLAAVSGRRYYVTHTISVSSGVPEFRVLAENDGQDALAKTRKLAEVGATPSSAYTSRSDVEVESKINARSRSSENTRPSRSFYNKSAIAILLKGGAYTIGQERQTTEAVPTLFETKSDSVGGLEVEWRHPKGFAIGGELFYFRNKWADSVGFSGTVSTLTYGVNGKYYLGIADIVYPYVGLGFGVAASSFSGASSFSTYDSSSSGIAYQGLIGVEFRFKYVGVNLQYKRLTADVKTTLFDGTTETNEMGGTGQLLGLAIHIPLR